MSPQQASQHLLRSRALPCAVAYIDRPLHHFFMTHWGILHSWDSLHCTNHVSTTISAPQWSQESVEPQLWVNVPVCSFRCHSLNWQVTRRINLRVWWLINALSASTSCLITLRKLCQSQWGQMMCSQRGFHFISLMMTEINNKGNVNALYEVILWQPVVIYTLVNQGRHSQRLSNGAVLKMLPADGCRAGELKEKLFTQPFKKQLR